MAQVVESLPTRYKALSSITGVEREREREREERTDTRTVHEQLYQSDII
jgi:hypothetical protein